MFFSTTSIRSIRLNTFNGSINRFNGPINRFIDPINRRCTHTIHIPLNHSIDNKIKSDWHMIIDNFKNIIEIKLKKTPNVSLEEVKQ